jgi:hypothetical protein
MKSDVSRFTEKLALRDAELREPTTKVHQATERFDEASSPQIGYKLPFSSDLVRFSTRMNGRNDDISEKATLCQGCPQYGKKIVYSRACWHLLHQGWNCGYPPFLQIIRFKLFHHGERPVKHPSIRGVVLVSCMRYAQNSLPRLSSTLSKRLAKNDLNKMMTNFGWRKKA